MYGLFAGRCDVTAALTSICKRLEAIGHCRSEGTTLAKVST